MMSPEDKRINSNLLYEKFSVWVRIWMSEPGGNKKSKEFSTKQISQL